VAVIVVEAVVSGKWLADTVLAEWTSTQIEIVFTDTLATEGLLYAVERRADDLVDVSMNHEARPILLAVSDNRAQMTSGSTPEFMALCTLAQHFGRPGTPTDQPWIESFFGHLKAEYPHLDRITDAALLRWEQAVIRGSWNGFASRPTSATSHRTTSTKGAALPSEGLEKPGSRRHARDASHTIAAPHRPISRRPDDVA
jgi:putative transposase